MLFVGYILVFWLKNYVAFNINSIGWSYFLEIWYILLNVFKLCLKVGFYMLEMVMFLCY